MLRTITTPIEAPRRRSPFNRIPSSTYRLQLSKSLDFGAAEKAISYLDELGITDLYLSPLFRARDASAHGYDVVSHKEVEPAFGGGEALQHLTDSAQAHGMGVLLDIVPNHMGINEPDNEVWWDVLENGPCSRYAHFFDIEWDPPTASLRHKLLLPFLGDPFGTVLERGELQLAYESGRFQLAYGPKRYPLSPGTWPTILDLAIERAASDEKLDEVFDEVASISTQLSNLPAAVSNAKATCDASRQRYREQAIARRRLSDVMCRHNQISRAVHAALNHLNGVAGHPDSFDKLEGLLNKQWYRLAYWRVAADEINYRRFFDINDLAALRVEDPDVFAHVHSLIRELLRENRITGLRVDHPDGLFDPERYFDRLQRLYRTVRAEQVVPPDSDERLYVVAEKILTGDERLPSSWPVAGTTGYDALNTISQLLVDRKGLQTLASRFHELTGSSDLPDDVAYTSKIEVLATSMSSELHMLTGQLHRIAQQSREAKDFTYLSLEQALREVIACFPVYRTYVRDDSRDVDPDDQHYIRAAVRRAQGRNPNISSSIFDFIASVLLLETPKPDEDRPRDEWRHFALKFQQVTGPVTAKGIEDTAFYRYFPLASLNEVGGELTPQAADLREFHHNIERRQTDWPHSMTATATHDTKRGEDVRARLHVLSEIPDQWMEAFRRWDNISWHTQQQSENTRRPCPAARYLLFQTLVGTWPERGPLNAAWSDYTMRILRYFLKALREAKLDTSWLNPNADYEMTATQYARAILDVGQSAELLTDIDAFAASIADAGYMNSLSQLVLKACLPGVPDFYQGTELWDFTLVDPDNRRPVDFPIRQSLLRELRSRFNSDPQRLVNDLMSSWPDARIKLFVTWRLMQLRREHSDLFKFGRYVPLNVEGTHNQHLLAFARQLNSESAIVIVPRLVQNLDASSSLSQLGEATIELPPELGTSFANVFTDETLHIEPASPKSAAAFGCFAPLPITVLIST